MNTFAITSWFKDVAGNFARDEEGAQVVEYALIIALVSIALAVALSAMPDGLFTAFIVRVKDCLAGNAAC